MYERVLAVVPIIGSGTTDDPRRPLYVPSKVEGTTVPGIIGFTSQISDDGRFALIEVVARNRAALTDLLGKKHPDVKVFEKGKARKEEIEDEFRKYKKNFSLDRMGVSLP